MRRCSFLPLFNVIHRLRRRDPCLRNNIVYRRLHALCVVLGEQTQVFVSDLDVGPYALIQHKKQKYRGALQVHKREWSAKIYPRVFSSKGKNSIRACPLPFRAKSCA